MENRENRQTVKIRRDGKGDRWAGEHRKELGKGWYLSDIDSLASQNGVHNTEDRLFVEYQPDGWEHRFNPLRNFAVLAIFDRKASEGAIETGASSAQLQRFLCYALGIVQPFTPVFAYIVGSAPPWKVLRIDVGTGERTGETVRLQEGNWTEAYRALGLDKLREEV